MIEPFHPEFTYPIFGDQEKIFGYKNLDIKLHFASGSLKQFLQITYDEKIQNEATPADDVEGELFKFLPADYTKSAVAFEQTVEEDAKTFKPMGELIGSYTMRAASSKGKGKVNGDGPAADAKDAVTYEMYKVSFHVLMVKLTTDHLGHTRIPRVPPANADLHPAVHRGRELHSGRRGSLGVCHIVSGL